MENYKLSKSFSSLLESKTFCARPFISLYVGVDGKFKFCCIDSGSNQEESIPSKHDISSTNLIDFFNSEKYQLMRTKFLNDIVPQTCMKCFYSKSKSSLDMSVTTGARIPAHAIDSHAETLIPQKNNEIFENLMNVRSIKIIELWFENKCNLKCRMCGPYCSNQIIQEWSGIVNSNDFMKNKYSNFECDTYNWTEKEESWINLFSLIKEIFKNNDQHILTFSMSGGEPILSDGMYRLLNFCIENNLAKNVVLHYKTNLTIVPEKLLTLWTQFRKIKLAASVDGLKETYEYVRYPAKWEKIQDNTKLVTKYKNIELKFKLTTQAYNVLSITNLYEWCLNHQINLEGLTDPLTNPNILNVRVLPKELKNIAAERLLTFYVKNKNHDHIKHRKNQFIWLAKYLQSEDWSHLFDDFIKFTKHIDKTRNQNIIDIMPEIEKYL
jgi:organic radical activating enzyme